MRLRQTPSQTVGPFFAYGLTPQQYGYPFRALAGAVLVDDETPGERIRIVGRVLDGEGNPVPDAMLEIWQADAAGRYAHPADARGSNLRFTGFGRCGTDPECRFVFETIKPGPPGDGQAPHVNVILFMRGLLSHVFTRIYFEDEAEANARDPILARLEEARRRTLLATRETTPRGTVYRLDLHMQGPDETVFFDV